jgi:hypothetical protein
VSDIDTAAVDSLKALNADGLTDFLYQRDGEIIAFARPDLAVAGTGSLSAVPVADIRVMSAVEWYCSAFATAR